MKKRLLWFLVVVGACVGYYFVMIKPALDPARPSITIEDLKNLRPAQPPPPELPKPVIPEPVIALPTPPPIPLPVVRAEAARSVTSPPAVVPIQNGVTIDFSYGGPQIKNQGKDAEALESALKEMSEATKDRTLPGKTDKQ